MRIKTYLGAWASTLLLGSAPACGITEQHLSAYMESHHLLPPRHRLEVLGGTLLSYDRGEFGGALLFLRRHGPARWLLSQNVQAMVSTADGVFVFTGLAHLSVDNGDIYQVQVDAGGAWVRHIMKLKGVPTDVHLLEDGSIGFRTYIPRPYPYWRQSHDPNDAVFSFRCERFKRQRIVQSLRCTASAPD